jgi:RNA polymerase sigma-70 factor (ECF subfamily)
MAAAAAILQVDARHAGAPVKEAGRTWVSVLAGGEAAERRLDAETQLVERCLSGDQTAWDEFVRTYTRRVYSVCYRFTNKILKLRI